MRNVSESHGYRPQVGSITMCRIAARIVSADIVAITSGTSSRV